MSMANRLARVSLLLMALAATVPVSAQEGASSPKAIVMAFYELGFGQKQVRAAFDRYVAPSYRQHNPRVPDGPEAAIVFLSKRFADNPEASNVVKRVIADGDLVALHVHASANAADRGVAIVDIFRVEGGRIVEHWDVIQPVPETAANGNTMF